MTRYIHQTYAPQDVDVFYQDLSSALQKYHEIYAETDIQQHQMCIDPTVQQKINAEHLILEHTPIYHSDDIQQHTIYHEVHQEEQPPQTETQAHVRDICNKTCKSNSDLVADYAGHIEEKTHIFDVCPKVFARKKKLRTHILIHSGDKPYVCEVCNRSFAHKNSLRRHYLIHTGDKPHVCDVCNRGFTQKNSLQRHYLTHTGDKLHVCEVCNRGFTHKDSLQSHYLIHTGDKPHVCEVCNLGFTDRSNWKRHILSHTGQMPHFCDICQRRFVRGKALKKHYLTHIGEKNNMSEICNTDFSQNSNIRPHFHVHSEDWEGKWRKGNAKDHEDQIIKAIAKPEAGAEQQQQEVDMEQTELDDYEITFSDISGFHEQALMNTEQQVHSENVQALASIDDPFTPMDHQAFNIGIQGLMTVDQQDTDHFELQDLKLIGHQTLAVIGRQYLADIGQQPCTVVEQQPMTHIVEDQNNYWSAAIHYNEPNFVLGNGSRCVASPPVPPASETHWLFDDLFDDL